MTREQMTSAAIGQGIAVVAVAMALWFSNSAGASWALVAITLAASATVGLLLSLVLPERRRLPIGMSVLIVAILITTRMRGELVAILIAGYGLGVISSAWLRRGSTNGR